MHVEVRPPARLQALAHGKKNVSHRLQALARCKAQLTAHPQVSNTSIAAGTIAGGGRALQTVPVALFIIAAAATVLPGAFAMRAFGRQPVVLFAGCLGLLGACLNLLSLYRGGFGLLVVGSMLQVRGGWVCVVVQTASGPLLLQ